MTEKKEGINTKGLDPRRKELVQIQANLDKLRTMLQRGSRGTDDESSFHKSLNSEYSTVKTSLLEYTHDLVKKLSRRGDIEKARAIEQRNFLQKNSIMNEIYETHQEELKVDPTKKISPLWGEISDEVTVHVKMVREYALLLSEFQKCEKILREIKNMTGNIESVLRKYSGSGKKEDDSWKKEDQGQQITQRSFSVDDDVKFNEGNIEEEKRTLTPVSTKKHKPQEWPKREKNVEKKVIDEMKTEKRQKIDSEPTRDEESGRVEKIDTKDVKRDRTKVIQEQEMQVRDNSFQQVQEEEPTVQSTTIEDESFGNPPTPTPEVNGGEIGDVIYPKDENEDENKEKGKKRGILFNLIFVVIPFIVLLIAILYIYLTTE